MKLAAKAGLLVAAIAICLSTAGFGGGAEAAVSGFSIRNSYTGKCLSAPGYNHYLTEEYCNKNIANQRWANVGGTFQNRFPQDGGWCLTGQSHEQRVYLRLCSSAVTTWSMSSLSDNARTKIWNATCGYVKVMPGSVVGCGAKTVASADYWYIDY